MNKNRKYYVIIILLIGIIIIEPFLSLNFGKQVILTKSQYENMKNISDKYSRQEKIVNKLKKSFLFKTDENKLLEGSLRGMIDGFDDPYTVYMNKKEYEDFSSQIDGSFTGIGILADINSDTSSIIVDYIFPNSPASEAGLKKGDHIIKVDDESIDIYKNNIKEIFNKIKGEANTKVNLTIKRDNQILNFDIVRRETEIPNVYSKKIDEIGYIKLLNFDNNSAKNFKSTLTNLKNNNINKLILDLRDNTGGLLTEATQICDLFLPPNTIISYTKDNKNVKTDIKTSKITNPIHIPTVVIVNENTASAAELFSGMMQDYKLATIIGSSTYGKGLVQIFNLLNDGAAIKFTVAEYFTPNGKKVNKIGIIPDIDLTSEMKKQTLNLSPYSDENMENLFEDVCFNKALEILNK